ncbi:SH3 domain-containing protein [Devosia submarina]|uniref:SH3 domain-containing protein n=1 Tax=Devosia submarina TaxID=1173082 RepID=UPI000D3BFDCA|nr:SH3 domain-containing protein [Devosia submarina]
MSKNQENVLVAALCGIVITAAGALAVQPAMAAGYQVDKVAEATGVLQWDVLNVRKWPEPQSQKTSAFRVGENVLVERCVAAETGADWCLVDAHNTREWVHSSYWSITTNQDR